MFDSLLFRPSLQTRESAQSQQGKATVADAPHGILGGLMVLKGNEMKMTFLLLWFVVFASVVSAQDENAKTEKAVVEEAAESSSFPESLSLIHI